MTGINAYLTFNGNCREAMLFYKDCLGGDLFLQTIDDSPCSNDIPESMKGFILHASLVKDEITILASDMVGEHGLIKGNSVSLMLNCDTEEDAKLYYEKLSQGGEMTHPLERTYWGALFGDLIDPYGIQWLLQYNKND